MNILIVIPAYNEEKTVKKVIEKCLDYGEVLVIDDSSRDNTLAEIKKTKARCLRNEVNKGKGYSLKRGFDYAVKERFDTVVTLDADLQHDPDLIPSFLEEMKGGKDLVIGRRKKRHSKMPYKRRCSNFFLSLIFSLLSRKWIKDTQSGYRAIRVDPLREIELESDSFELESEILMKMSRKGYEIGEVSISVIYGEEKSHINPLKEFSNFLRILLKCGNSINTNKSGKSSP